MRLRGSQLRLDRGPKFGGRLAHNGGAEMKAARANKAVTVAAQPPLTVGRCGGGGGIWTRSLAKRCQRGQSTLKSIQVTPSIFWSFEPVAHYYELLRNWLGVEVYVCTCGIPMYGEVTKSVRRLQEL